MKRFILTASLWGLGLSAGLIAPLGQARECGCGDLPAMLNELTQLEYMQKLFKGYSEYMPYGIQTHTELKERAEAQLNTAFYGDNAATGTTGGAHAALGTDIYDPNCPILAYLYDKKGNKVLNKDGTHKAVPATEKSYKPNQCAARTRADLAHERAHQDHCLKLVANNKTHLWDRLTFFAADDSEAYKAGAEVLRTEFRSLAAKCGWENSTKNRLPNINEAEELAKQAAKARPARRKK